MMNDFRIYLLLSAFILCSCSESTEENYKVFTEKKAQSATERTVRDLTPVDSLNMTKAFNDSPIFDLKLVKSAIFVKMRDRIVRLEKTDFSTENIFKIPEGRGPGEFLNFGDFDVENGLMVILDRRARKTVLYDLEGNFQEEFLNDQELQVGAIEIADENTFYYQILSTPASNYDLFYELFYEEGGKQVIRRRFQEQTEGVDLLAYSGKMIYHDNSIYYGGYSEPLIRRYDLSGEEAELVFSRAVIDDYDSEKNYQKARRTTGGGQLFGYSNEAKYASWTIDVDDNYLYSVRHANGKSGYKFLDLYKVEDGSYRGSFSVRHYPKEIAVGENYIYTIEHEAGEPLQRHLNKYEKPKIKF